MSQRHEDTEKRRVISAGFSLRFSVSLAVMVTTGQDDYFFVFHHVDQPVFKVYTAGPATGQLELQEFGFACTGEGSTFCFTQEGQDSFGDSLTNSGNPRTRKG